MKALLKPLYHKMREPFLNQYPKFLEREMVGSCESVLDVGCGASSPLRFFSYKLPRTVGVDGFAPSIEKSRAHGIHREYREMNIMDLSAQFPEKSFDGVVASEVIEHLTKVEGLRLLDMMESIARRKVVVFTPTGFLPQDEYDGNVYQKHLSGWTPEEMRGMGYKVYGLNGLKWLRGERSKIAWKPRPLWEMLSLWSQPLVESNPSFAFHILCVKTL